MQVVLDGQTIENEATTVAQAIFAGAGVAEQTGRRIVEVAVDGFTLSATDLRAPAQLERAAEEVQLTSVNPLAMVRETFCQAGESLDEVDRLQKEAAELLQSDDVSNAMERLDEAFSIWMMVQEAVISGADFIGMNLDEVRIDDEALMGDVGELQRHLTELSDALRRKDLIALSDALLYSMPGVVARWQTVLGGLTTAVESRTR